jgi:ATP-grasp domain, R2K clade family 3
MKRAYKILFPSEPFNKKEADKTYEPEVNLCNLLGIEYYLFDYDGFLETGKVDSNINYEDTCILIYRGWMLKPLQYKHLIDSIFSDSAYHITFVNNSWEYDNCHCFPRSYHLLKEWTPKICEIESWEDIYRTDIKFDFFIKDYVKSIKTPDGVERLSKNIRKEELTDKIAEFIKERGKLFTGNIVLKEFVNLKRIKGKTNEWRVFYFNGKDKPQSQERGLLTENNFLSMHQNSYLSIEKYPPLNDIFNNEHPPLKLIKDVGDNLSHLSNFFTVDFALTENDNWIVIETGDGQVSGLPVGEEFHFYNKLVNKLNI